MLPVLKVITALDPLAGAFHCIVVFVWNVTYSQVRFQSFHLCLRFVGFQDKNFEAVSTLCQGNEGRAANHL